MRSYSDKFKVNHLNSYDGVKKERAGSVAGLGITISFFVILSAVTFCAVVFCISV